MRRVFFSASLVLIASVALYCWFFIRSKNEERERLKRELVWASANGKMDEIKHLIQRGVSVKDESLFLKTYPLTAAVRYSKNTNVVLFLLSQGANLNVIDSNHYTALERAIINNDYQMVELLLKNGADPNLPSKPFANPWFVAGRSSDSIRKLLVEYGANTNLQK